MGIPEELFWGLTLAEFLALQKSYQAKRRETWLQSCQLISAMEAIWGSGKSVTDPRKYLPEDLKHG